MHSEGRPTLPIRSKSHLKHKFIHTPILEDGLTTPQLVGRDGRERVCRRESRRLLAVTDMKAVKRARPQGHDEDDPQTPKTPDLRKAMNRTEESSRSTATT